MTMHSIPGILDYGMSDAELAKLVCPLCANQLTILASLDPWCCQLRCGIGHMLFFPKKERVTGNPGTAEGAPPIESSDKHVVIRTWLGMPEFRRLLNGQLAMILRRIEEDSIYAYDDAAPKFRFCPHCGAGLQEVDNKDTWTRGLQCPRGHKYAERGHALGFIRDGVGCRIHAEIDSKSLLLTMRRWLDNKHHMMREQMHTSIRQVFANELARHQTP